MFQSTRTLFTLLIVACLSFILLASFLFYKRTHFVVTEPIIHSDEQRFDLNTESGVLSGVTMEPFFIENSGQAPENILYYFKGQKESVYFTSSGVVFENISSVEEPKYRFEFNNISPGVSISGKDIQKTKINYFVGSQRFNNIDTFGKIIYHNIYPNIDAEFFFQNGVLKYDFIIAPGGDPNIITLNFIGIQNLSLEINGDLTISTLNNHYYHKAPVTYQNSLDYLVQSWYIIDKSGQSVRFGLSDYDKTKELIIDPELSTLSASTYLGGSGDDSSYSVISNSNNTSIYIVGKTSSANFPTSTGAYDITQNGSYDAYIAKFSADLNTLDAVTFIGGSATDVAYTISLDSSENVYIAGVTGSSDFPTSTGAYGPNYNGGVFDVFVSKLSADLSTLQASTFVGSAGREESYGIVLDDSSNVFLSGWTDSASFPTTTGVFDTTQNGNDDAFVSKLSSDLTTLQASTYLGGSLYDRSNDIFLDTLGSVLITGKTTGEFPTTTGAFRTTNNGTQDAFVSKLSSDLTTLQASTYLGGAVVGSVNSDDEGIDVIVDSLNNIFVVGTTGASDFPTTTGGYQSSFGGGDYDTFVSKLSSGLTNLLASTYFGGSGWEVPSEIDIDNLNRLYITGYVYGATLPTTTNAYDTVGHGVLDTDGFTSKFSSDLVSLLGSTYIGGDSGDTGFGIDVVGTSIYISGYTPSTNFPTTTLAYNTSYNGGFGDIFLALISSNSAPTLTTSTPSQTSANFVTVTTTISDTDGDITEFSIEYSADGITWASSTIGTVEASTGAPNTSTGRVYNIATDLAPANTVFVTTTWNIAADLPDTATSTVYLRFVPSDGTENGSTATTIVFSIDTKNPTAPGDLTVYSLTSSTIAFTFPNTTSSDENFSEYKIHYSTSSPVTSENIAFTSTTDSNLASSTFAGVTTSTVFEGLIPNTTYYFNLFAYDVWDHVTSSTEISTTSLAAVPSSFVTSSITSSSVTFSLGSNGNPTSTEYYVATLDDAKNSGWTASTTVSVTDLSCETEYNFRARSRNSVNRVTDWVDTISVTTGACPGTPAVALSAASMSLSEGGSAASYTIVLNTEPADSVQVSINASISGQVSLSSSTLTFTAVNWATPQSIIVTPVDDSSVEGVQAVSLTHTATSNDINYNGISITSLSITLADNDSLSSGGGGLPPGYNAPNPPRVDLPPTDTLPCNEMVEDCVIDEDFLPKNRLIRVVQPDKPTNLPTVSLVNSRDVLLLLDTDYSDSIAIFESLEPSTDFSRVSYEPNTTKERPWLLSDIQGKHCFNAKFRNTSPKVYEYETYLCLVLDTVAPVPPVVNVVHTGIVNGVFVSNPAISGKTEPYATIVITKEKQLSAVSLASVSPLRIAAATTYYIKANGKGAWTFTFPVSFDPGNYTITLAAEDSAGNSSEPSMTTMIIPSTLNSEKPVEPEEPKDTGGTPPGDSQIPTTPVDPEPFVPTVGESETAGVGGGTDPLLPSTGGGAEVTDLSSDLVKNDLVINGSEGITTTLVLKDSFPSTTQTTNQVMSLAVDGWHVLGKWTKSVAANFRPILEAVNAFTNDPDVEKMNTRVVVPGAVAIATINVASGFGAQLLLILRYFFTQPLMLLRLRRRKTWGVVYNGFTKQPIDLATVRLIDAKTGTIRESRVTDMKGRYLFVTEPGEYRIEVIKSGFAGVSEHLRYFKDDGIYSHIYHNNIVQVVGKYDVIGKNIPLDPDGVIRSTKEVLRDYARRIGHTSASRFGIILAICTLIISPTLFVFSVFLLHILLFFVLRWYVYRPLPNNVGVVRDETNKKPLHQTVVRIFDAAYNKLVDTKITDQKGRYAALVGPSVYYVTFEKPAYEKKQTETMDFHVEANIRGGAIIVKNELLRKSIT